jgi:hypothetical protein
MIEYKITVGLAANCQEECSVKIKIIFDNQLGIQHAR